MLLTFRLFLGGASLVILALAVIARGLIAMPEVRTQVGEVPSLGRSLIQEAMILRAFIDVSDGPTAKRAEETKAVRELSHLDVALAPAAAHKLQDNRREVKIWGFRATPDVKAHGELPVE